MAPRISFPLAFTIPGGEGTQTMTSEFDLAASVEMISEWYDNYTCVDATGQRLRVLIDMIEVLLVEPIAGSWSVADLTIAQLEADGLTLYGEFSRGVLHRVLEVNRAVSRALPTSWKDSVTTLAKKDWRHSDLEPKRFDLEWRSCRTGGKTPS